MANQFDAKIRFDPIAWSACDRATKAYAKIVDMEYGPVKWKVVFMKDDRTVVAEGSSTTPLGARAACRRAIKKYAKEQKGKKQ